LTLYSVAKWCCNMHSLGVLIGVSRHRGDGPRGDLQDDRSLQEGYNCVAPPQQYEGWGLQRAVRERAKCAFECASTKHLVLGVRSRGSLTNKVFEQININRQHDNATDVGPSSHDGNGYVTAAAEMLAAMATAKTAAMATMTTMMAAVAVDDNVGNIKIW
jgi:hypothetical protein